MLSGAGAIMWDATQSKILVVKGNEKYSLPKGHLKCGELPHIGSAREIYEETSLCVKIEPTYPSIKLSRYLYYHIIVDNANEFQTLETLDPIEISAVMWVSLSQLMNDIGTQCCNKHLRYVIDKWVQIRQNVGNVRLLASKHK
jgi:ADP-ribose pyrophosphatase YjhB (NUDIX family)